MVQYRITGVNHAKQVCLEGYTVAVNTYIIVIVPPACLQVRGAIAFVA